MQVPVTIVQIFLTTHCNMKCPECSCGMQIIPKSNKYFVDFDYIKHSAKYFYGVDTISIMGGEPTMHPNFAEWSLIFKELYGCKRLTLETNGTMFDKIPEAFTHYDKILVTRYHKDIYDGCPDNLDKINFLKDYYKERDFIWVNEIEHVSRKTKGTKPCYRSVSGGIAYEGGRLYPCCVGPGLLKKVSIPLTEDWRDQIKTIYPPCESCFLAV